MKKIIFIDRDGTLIYEPKATKQINSLADMRFMPGVISALKELSRAGWRLVIVTNQDALGTPQNPRANYNLINKKMQEVFASEGVTFDAILECPHKPQDNCDCRKPRPRLGLEYLVKNPADLKKSYMVGDRDSDLAFGQNIGVKSFKLTPKLGWADITARILSTPRTGEVKRKTKETDINLALNLDGSGKSDIKTGLPFFDHCLEQLPKHAGFDLKIKCKGDLPVGPHHTVEDIALALGAAFKAALGDKNGIERYAAPATVVMDEARADVALDLSSRPLLVYASTSKEKEDLTEHFLQSFCAAAGVNMHVKIESKNAHHMAEACAKAFARALKAAVKITGRGVPSSKGVL